MTQPTKENKSAVAGWQERLDGQFPIGAKVTVVDDVPENLDTSTTFHTAYLEVLSVSDNDVPTVQVFPVNFDKDFRFTVAKVEDWNGNPEIWLITQENEDENQIVLDKNFSESTAESLRQLRSEMLEG